ncbi:methionyl-tRNA formyltransferase [Paracoccaceae bacterium GXU_MW_L88]
MRLVFMGTPDFSVPALEALAKAHEVVAVYSQPPARSGRGQKERPSPVHAKALELGVPVFTPENFKTDAAKAEFAAHDADLAVVVAYGLILPQAVLVAPRLGCWNIHASLLPRWRGAAPIQRAIMAGDAKSGVCIMQMEKGLDTGPVLLRRETEITPQDTAASLHDRLSDIGAEAILAAIDAQPEAVPQAEDGVTYAAKIDKAEAKVDWAKPSAEVARLIRGLSPFPGAWSELDSTRIKLLMAEETDGDSAPGTLIGDGITVACGTGAVRITRLQRAGKGAQDADEFLRGYPLTPGMRFDTN